MFRVVYGAALLPLRKNTKKVVMCVGEEGEQARAKAVRSLVHCIERLCV